MSRMPNVGDTQRIICNNCSEPAEEWADLNITNIISDIALDMRMCLPCLDIASLVLDIDLENEPVGLFRVSEFGQIEPIVRDNN